jgi:hypothetical protein
MNWIDLNEARDQWWALVKAVMKLRVSKNVGKFLSGCITGVSSRKAQLHEDSTNLLATILELRVLRPYVLTALPVTELRPSRALERCCYQPCIYGRNGYFDWRRSVGRGHNGE